MKKMIVSAVVMIALLGSGSVMAQDSKKECTKAKTECSKKEECKEKKTCCSADKKACTKAEKKEACPKADKKKNCTGTTSCPVKK